MLTNQSWSPGGAEETADGNAAGGAGRGSNPTVEGILRWGSISLARNGQISSLILTVIPSGAMLYVHNH